MTEYISDIKDYDSNMNYYYYTNYYNLSNDTHEYAFMSKSEIHSLPAISGANDIITLGIGDDANDDEEKEQ